ncbi:MAG: CPBP family intramembrane glutamic endopeptidase [Bacillaceae bacterium]
MKQKELIKHISDEQLQRSLLYTQLLLLSLSAVCILFSFPPFYKIQSYFTFNLVEIVVIGGGLVTIALLNDFVLMRFVPEDWLDDGGINERLFKGMSLGKIAAYTILIAISEELFFRGVLQSQFGLIISSIIFALVHIRYLEKVLLFCSVVVVSFLFGIVFEVTESLVVTIVAHFLIDFILGCYIRFSNDEGSDEENG